LVIDRTAIVPQPARGASATLALHLQGPATSFELNVYTIALTLAVHVSRSGDLHQGWNSVQFDIGGLASGFYYYTVTVQQGGESSPRALGKMAIMR
jgi:hypothetical protein